MSLISFKIKALYEVVCLKLFQYEIKELSNLHILSAIYLKHQLLSACYHMEELFTKNHHNSIYLVN